MAKGKQATVSYLAIETATSETVFSLSSLVTVAKVALDNVGNAKTARETASDNFSSFNRGMAVLTARACHAKVAKDFVETCQKHGAYKAFKGTVSATRTICESATFPQEKITVPKGKGWTIAGKVYATGETVTGAQIVASIVAGDANDTSPLVFTRAASKVRNLEKNARKEREKARIDAINVLLASEEGAELRAQGKDAELIVLEGTKPDGEVTPELAELIVKGENRARELRAKDADRIAQKDRENYRASLLAYLRANMDETLAGEVSAILSKYRVETIAATQPAQVAQSAAA